MSDNDFNERLQNTGRNDQCPCGSGKKYKKCHLAKDELAQHEELQKQQEAVAEASVDDDSDEKVIKPTHSVADSAPRLKPSKNVTRHNAPRRQAGM